MQPATFAALSLGALGVLQAAVNRRIAATWGLAPTILLNGLVVLALCIGFYVAARRGYIDAMIPGTSIGQVRPYWLLPGVFGFLLITGLPWAVAQVGATQVFVAMVFAQMTTSLVWDRLVEDISLSPTRIGGAILCAAGVVLASWSR